MAKQPKKKKVVRDLLNDISPYELEGTLVDLRTRVTEWIDKYGPTAHLDWDSYFTHAYESDPSPRFNVYRDREETNAEYDKRIDDERISKEINESHERAELERLQKKFAGKN